MREQEERGRIAAAEQKADVEINKEGATGVNFLFDWSINPTLHEPLFEGIIISTSGQQGISSKTNGKDN